MPVENKRVWPSAPPLGRQPEFHAPVGQIWRPAKIVLPRFVSRLGYFCMADQQRFIAIGDIHGQLERLTRLWALV